MKRIALISAGLAILAAACGEGSSPTQAVEPSATDTAATTITAPNEVPTSALGVLPEGPSALQTSDAPEFPPPLVDPAEIISGGPPPDGIPPLEAPEFLDVASALDLLADAEPVVVLEIDGDARAYPVQVMIWHEIVNDTVGGVPVSITYCPLCNSAVSYRREIRGVETTFGTSGRLFSSALVMYDRATETLWTHFDGKAVVGLLAGEQLEAIPSPLMSWADYRDAYPTGLVLDPGATGFVRDYGRNPYFGYDDDTTAPFLFTGSVDDRAAAKQRVVGVTIGDESAAFTLQAISGDVAAASQIALADIDLIILWKAGQSTALEEERVDTGRDVGTVGVFLPVVEGQTLTFSAADGAFLDAETRSTWNVAGEAINGELAGARLERVPHLDTFWFAWATYQPGTVLVDSVE